jgi:hypothetical protein
LLKYSGANPADQIKDQESLRTPESLQYGSKHPKDKHVEKNMADTAVHEYASEQLVRFEQRRFIVVKRSPFCYIKLLDHVLGGKHQNINDNKVDYDRGVSLK